jgi:lysine-ketoglutarate reductase/saccharopine dehydrogenase-like protein (TIGR00300 family)
LSNHAEIEIIEPKSGLPDMVFTANAGLVYGNTYIPSRFHYPHRQGESGYFSEWFVSRNFDLTEMPGNSTFEGEGDALFQPGVPLLWAGYGVRTSLFAHRFLIDILDIDMVPLRLVDERFYHLDMCFCPLPGGRVFYYPDAFDQESLDAIRARVQADRRFEVDREDAFRFACNAVQTGESIILNAASKKLTQRLSKWGFMTLVAPVKQFILAGGAVKCMVLRLSNPVLPLKERMPDTITSRLINLQGHLLDTGLMKKIIDHISDAGCSFEIESFRAGLRHDQESSSDINVAASSPEKLDTLIASLMPMGIQISEGDEDVLLKTITQDGVAPSDFYSTTIYPTDIRLNGRWIRASQQRMDAFLVVLHKDSDPKVRCTVMHSLRKGDKVVCGVKGIRIHTHPGGRKHDTFEFMSSGVSSERRVESAIDAVAWEMQRVRERKGRIVVVAGPVVIHTGAGKYLAWLVRNGYVQAFLGGNAIAVHDIEQALFGTSLGVDLKSNIRVQGGHRHHLAAINRLRACGGITRAVKDGVLRQGVMYECVKQGVPFSLAGSIRDDGPLPDTRMDLIEAQKEHAELIKNADMILMLSSMLHSIGVGNMTPAGVRMICVDINPAVVTKLADRGSVESFGIVTDVGLFLNLLVDRLKE